MKMVLTTVTANLVPDKIEEAAALYNAEVLPILRQQGVQQAYLAVDAVNNTMAEITVWETQAQADASISSPERRAVIGRLAAVFASAPVRQTYDVKLSS
jgi:quinol monooxygenase YgiN